MWPHALIHVARDEGEGGPAGAMPPPPHFFEKKIIRIKKNSKNKK
jgi:hypothetical protein